MQWGGGRMLRVSWTQQQGSCCLASRPCRVWWWSADWSRVFGLRARQATGRMGRQTHRGDIPSGASTDWHWPQGLSNVPFNGETVNKVRVARPHSCRSLGPRVGPARRRGGGTQRGRNKIHSRHQLSREDFTLHSSEHSSVQFALVRAEVELIMTPRSASVFLWSSLNPSGEWQYWDSMAMVKGPCLTQMLLGSLQ